MEDQELAQAINDATDNAFHLLNPNLLVQLVDAPTKELKVVGALRALMVHAVTLSYALLSDEIFTKPALDEAVNVMLRTLIQEVKKHGTTDEDSVVERKILGQYVAGTGVKTTTG